MSPSESEPQAVKTIIIMSTDPEKPSPPLHGTSLRPGREGISTHCSVTGGLKGMDGCVLSATQQDCYCFLLVNQQSAAGAHHAALTPTAREM